MSKGMTIRVNKKTGNVVTEMHGYEGQTCMPTAEQIIEKLKVLGVKVDLETFHIKSSECAELVHVTETIQMAKWRGKNQDYINAYTKKYRRKNHGVFVIV